MDRPAAAFISALASHLHSNDAVIELPYDASYLSAIRLHILDDLKCVNDTELSLLPLVSHPITNTTPPP